MNPSTPSTPTSPSTSVPGGPLGRYLLHPGSDTSTVVHHVLHVLAGIGRAAIPALLVVVVLIVAARVVLAVTRRQRAGGGRVVIVAPGPEVEPAGAEALWNGLHGVLRRGGLAGLVSGRPGWCRYWGAPPPAAGMGAAARPPWRYGPAGRAPGWYGSSISG